MTTNRNYLRPGQLIMVRYGNIISGRQMAMVVKLVDDLNVRVRKFSGNKKQWQKNDIKIPLSDVLNDDPPANLVEAARGGT